MGVNEAVRKIRGTVNRPVFFHNPTRHDFVPDMTFASMDAVEDVQLAIEAFKETRSGDEGRHLLTIYGLFQAVSVQQDALINLAKGLGLNPTGVWSNSDSKYVRNIRKKYFGHPTKNIDSDSGKKTYHGITRISVDSPVLQGWTYPNFRIEDINIEETLEKHSRWTEATLGRILADLTAKGETYMKKFTDALPTSDHHYELGKIYAWAHGPTDDRKILAGTCADILEAELDSIKTGLEARYENAEQVGDIMRQIGKAKYCLKVTKKAIAASKTDGKNEFYLEAHLDTLERTHREIVEFCEDVNTQFGN